MDLRGYILYGADKQLPEGVAELAGQVRLQGGDGMVFGGAREEDVQAILDVMGECFGCVREGYFRDILEKLARVFLAQPAICAISQAGSLTPEAVVQHGVSPQLLAPYLAENPSCREIFLNKVMAGDGAQLLSLQDMPFKRSVCDLNLAHGIHTCIVGRFSDSDHRTLLLCIPNPLKPPLFGQLNLLRLVFPHLHHAMKNLFLGPRLSSPSLLSQREQEVLEWMVGGKTNWEISRILAVTEDTVKFHLKNIYRKLQACNKGHAIARAFQLGILTQEEQGRFARTGIIRP